MSIVLNVWGKPLLSFFVGICRGKTESNVPNLYTSLLGICIRTNLITYDPNTLCPFDPAHTSISGYLLPLLKPHFSFHFFVSSSIYVYPPWLWVQPVDLFFSRYYTTILLPFHSF